MKSVDNFGPYLCKGLDRTRLHDRTMLAAMSRVPRDKFVPETWRASAYEDQALAIGFGQTISQPYIVALMTQELRLPRNSKVLEIGTGSGYQAAVLSELGAEVVSMEVVSELADRASETLERLGYTKVKVIKGDGWDGYEQLAPYDGIIITAASPSISPTLIAQLRDNGRMVLPLEGGDDWSETLVVVEKHEGELKESAVGTVRFVPLTGKARGGTGEFRQ